MNRATVVITPRDRYTGVVECIQAVYESTEEPVDLMVLDLGYPPALIKQVEEAVADREGAEIIPLGLMIPMEAFDKVRHRIKTPYTVLLDNDSRPTPGWLAALIECAEEENAALVSPLTLEREGLDEGPDLRNHLYTSELRVVDVEGTPYLIEHKPYRRAPKDEIPQERAPTDQFELHCVMMETAVLQQLDMPPMVIREHIDIGMQIRAMGRKLMAEPRSVVIFDNLRERMSWSDLRFFWYRWSPEFSERSSRLFEKRWGYKFYTERSMLNWVFRRKVYLLSLYLGLPPGVANKLSTVLNRLFRKQWDPHPDPIGASEWLYRRPEAVRLRQLPSDGLQTTADAAS